MTRRGVFGVPISSQRTSLRVFVRLDAHHLLMVPKKDREKLGGIGGKTLRLRISQKVQVSGRVSPSGNTREGICGCTGMDIFLCVDFQYMLKWRFTSVTSIHIRWHHRRGAGVIVFEKLCPVDRKPRYSCAERCKPSAPVPTYGTLAATYTCSILPDAS